MLSKLWERFLWNLGLHIYISDWLILKDLLTYEPESALSMAEFHDTSVT